MDIKETKWRFGLKLCSEATDNDKQDFFQFWLDVFRQKTEWRDGDLSEYFADEFWLFSVHNSNPIDENDRHMVHCLLRRPSVNVTKERNILIADALFAVVKEELLCLPYQKESADETTNNKFKIMETKGWKLCSNEERYQKKWR